MWQDAADAIQGMIRAVCQTCKLQIHIDQETGNRFDDAAATMPHRETPQPIALYVREFYSNRQYVKLDFAVPESENLIASKIVTEALKIGADAFKVQTVRKGDYLILRW